MVWQSRAVGHDDGEGSLDSVHGVPDPKLGEADEGIDFDLTKRLTRFDPGPSHGQSNEW